MDRARNSTFLDVFVCIICFNSQIIDKHVRKRIKLYRQSFFRKGGLYALKILGVYRTGEERWVDVLETMDSSQGRGEAESGNSNEKFTRSVLIFASL